MIGVLALIGPLLGGLGGLSAIGLGAIPFVGPLLKFFGTGAGRLVGVVVIVAAAYGYGWLKGDAHGDRQCTAKIETLNRNWQDRVDAAAAEFARARAARDAEVDAAIAAAVKDATDQAGEAIAEREQRVKDYEAELAKRKNAAGCILGDDDIGLRRRPR